MRMKLIVVLLVLLATIGVTAQENAAPPQTARQALIEMFFGKKPGTLVHHLPAVTRTALDKAGALTAFEQYSVMMSQTQTQQTNVQTFESGPVLLAGENTKTGEKFEITVEKDTLRGDQDDLDLSFRSYKDGKAQRSPFMPQMIFSMKKEAQVWTLNEIAITLHVPLADPELLKTLTEKMQPQTRASVVPISQSETPTPSVGNSGSDAAVLSAMHMILSAETTYASRYPNTGYACILSNLDGFGSGEPNERQAMLINSGLASGRKYGFLFTISNCGGPPAARFTLTAVPNSSAFGRKAFCADESGTIRSSDDGNAATCLSRGTPVQ
ncbi:MAG TPA: hypothetical protein VKV39_04880 [Candidatus Sulfotelmatobacter sp.]|nr:hypothetical protein [Candidatus Sulfotelmatobacter sp.]